MTPVSPPNVACFEHQPGCVDDKGAAPGVRRAAFEPEFAVEPTKPIDDTAGLHALRTATLGMDHRSVRIGLAS